MSYNYFILLGYILINLITYFVFGYDKRLAKKSRIRVSENKLLFISLIGGSLGAVIAMKYFRHKTSKKSFKIKLAGIIIVQLILLIILFKDKIPAF